MKNKKGSTFTNPMTIMMILAVIGMFSGIILNMGNSMTNQQQTNIDYESVEWLSQETGFKIKNKTAEDGVITQSEITEKWYISNETEGGNTKDFAIEYFFGIEWLSKVFDFFGGIYNLPSFFIRWSPLNQEDFSIVINAWNIVCWFAIAGVAIYVIRGIKT